MARHATQSLQQVTPGWSENWLRGSSLLGFALFWQIIAWFLDSDLLPAPTEVLVGLWAQIIHGELLTHLGITLIRVLVSFLIAMLIGVALGVFMGRHKSWDAGLDGILVIGLNIPALVTIILCYIWFGLTEVAAVVAVAINKIPMVIVTIREGTRALDKQLMEVAQVYQLSRWETFRKVYLPQLYPYLVSAARNGLALIWKIVLVVELLGRSDGVGFQLGTFFQLFDILGILVYTLAFVIVILLIEAWVMRPAEAYLTRWRK